MLLGALTSSALPRCVVDNVTARQLPHQVCELTGACALLSVEWCAAECRKANYRVGLFNCQKQNSP